MGLEEVDLTNPDEGTSLLRLVTEGVDDLVCLQGKVLVRPDPQGEHGVHGGLGGGPDDETDIEFIETCVCDPVDLGIESLDVLLLLCELGLGDEQGETDLVVVGGIELLADVGVDLPHDLPSVGGPDVHSLDGVSLVGESGLLDDVEVPVCEVVFLQGHFSTS